MYFAHTRICALALVTMVGAARPSDAHVTVTPREAPAKSSPQLTIRVPTEKDVPTESVRLEFPPGLQVLRLKPLAGWTAELERNESGKIVAVTYGGGKIGPEEYQEFSLVARLPDATGPIRIKAYQRYAGGVQVAWINDAEPQPAPTITVTPAVSPGSSGADPFAVSAQAPGPPSQAARALQTGGSGGLWMSGVSLALSVLALAVALRPRRRRAA